MTRQELENGMNDIYFHNHYTQDFGTGYYWRQVASQNWHDNINDVQSRYSLTDFVVKFFEVAITKVDNAPKGKRILTLDDVYKNNNNFEK